MNMFWKIPRGIRFLIGLAIGLGIDAALIDVVKAAGGRSP